VAAAAPFKEIIPLTIPAVIAIEAPLFSGRSTLPIGNLNISSTATVDEVLIAPPALIAAKAALYLATKDAGLSKTALALRLGVSEAVGRRLINPRYQSKIVNIEKAMAVVGRRAPQKNQ
jgi:hypothetical protein